MRERLENLLAGLTAEAKEAVNPDPLGAENGPHQYTYKPSSYPEQDTVIASEEGSSAGGAVSEPLQTPAPAATPEKDKVLKLTPDELVRLAPRLKAYLRQPDPDWRDLVDAAGFLRSDLDVSKSLWGEACVTMGRDRGGDRHRHRLDQGPRAFPDDGRGIFPRHGHEKPRPASSISTARSGACGGRMSHAQNRPAREVFGRLRHPGPGTRVVSCRRLFLQARSSSALQVCPRHRARLGGADIFTDVAPPGAREMPSIPPVAVRAESHDRRSTADPPGSRASWADFPMIASPSVKSQIWLRLTATSKTVRV